MPKTKAASTPAAEQQQVLTRVLKEAVKSGKYTVGQKAVIAEMKSAKLVIAASPVASRSAEEAGLMKEAEKNKVPVVTVSKSAAELGKMVGRPFRVSAIALRGVAEGDFRELVGSSSQPKPAE
jgi:ribosomal protein L30E